MISDEELNEWYKLESDTLDLAPQVDRKRSCCENMANWYAENRVLPLIQNIRAERKAREILQDVLQKMQREAANANINGCVITKKYVDSTVEKALADVDKILKGSGE